MWSEIFLGIFLQGFICQTHTQEPQIVPYIRIFFVLIQVQHINLSSVRAKLEEVQVLHL